MIAKLQLLEALKERFGDEVIEIVEKTIGKNTKAGYASLAARKGSNSIEDLISVLWEPATNFGMEYTSESTVNGVQMKCTKCAWHEYMAVSLIIMIFMIEVEPLLKQKMI